MRRWTFIAALVLLAPLSAHADILAGKSFGTVINNAALNGSPTTGYIELAGSWSGLVLDISATRVAYTDVGFTCVSSPDKSTDFIITETLPGGSTSQLHPIYTVSASVKITVTVNTAGYRYVKCTFTGTSAGATDYVTVTAFATRGL